MMCMYHGQMALLLIAMVAGMFLSLWAAKQEACCKKFTRFVGVAVAIVAFLLMICLTTIQIKAKCWTQCPINQTATQKTTP